MSRFPQTRYLLSRLGGMLVVMSLVGVLVFILTRAASGDPIAVLLGDQATAEDIARVQKLYGLDKPLPVQFGIWVNQLLHGNLGDSIAYRLPVMRMIGERLPVTLALTGLAASLEAVRKAQLGPKVGDGLEMRVIAAAVVGGVAISGGRGRLIGCLIGVALLQTIAPALNFLRIPAEWEKACQGLIILLAVASDAFDRKRAH